jgi:homospermidine synthase
MFFGQIFITWRQMKNPMRAIQKCDKVAKQYFLEITTPYFGKFDTNYNTFKNSENLNFWFFQRFFLGKRNY